jgi:hypothetical protein
MYLSAKIKVLCTNPKAIFMMAFGFLIYAYFYQLHYFANKYYELYLDDEYAFHVSDKIINARKKELKFLVSKLKNHKKLLKRDIKLFNSLVEKAEIDNNKSHLVQLSKEKMEALEGTIKWINSKENTYQKRKIVLNDMDFHYFSVVTATTTGYGDISPLNTEARLLIRYQLYLSLLLSGLIISFFSKLFLAINDVKIEEGNT